MNRTSPEREADAPRDFGANGIAADCRNSIQKIRRYLFVLVAAAGGGSAFRDFAGQDWYVYHAINENDPFFSTALSFLVTVLGEATAR